MSDRVVVFRIQRHRRGLWHIQPRSGHSDLSRHLHGIQREPTHPQPYPGQLRLPRDAGHFGSAAGTEIQLPHQRGKRLREQLHGLYCSIKQSWKGGWRGNGPEHVSAHHVSFQQLRRPPAHRGREYSPTSPTSSQSTSAGWSGPTTPPSAPSPTTRSSSTTTHALTLWSISSTTLGWTCKCEPPRPSPPPPSSMPQHCFPPLRSSSSIALTDKNGSFISTLSMALYQVLASSRAPL